MPGRRAAGLQPKRNWSSQKAVMHNARWETNFLRVTGRSGSETLGCICNYLIIKVKTA
jgi:hypothetical protein